MKRPRHRGFGKHHEEKKQESNKKILDYLSGVVNAGIREISRKAGLNIRTVRKRVIELEQNSGLVEIKSQLYFTKDRELKERMGSIRKIKTDDEYLPYEKEVLTRFEQMSDEEIEIAFDTYKDRGINIKRRKRLEQ